MLIGQLLYKKNLPVSGFLIIGHIKPDYYMCQGLRKVTYSVVKRKNIENKEMF